MSFLTRDQVADWLNHQRDEKAFYCEDCLTKLVKTETAKGVKLYCPNEMCLNDEQYDPPEKE